MLRRILPLLLLITTLPLSAVTLKSSIGIYAGVSEIHISSYEEKAPFRTAANAELMLTPFSIGNDCFQAGLYISGLYTSPTLIYDSVRYDSFIRGGGGLVFDYRFMDILEGELSFGASVGRYINIKAYTAAIESTVALKIKPVEFLSFTPRAVFRAESGQFSFSLQIGASADIRWKR